ncbi:MAG: cysteine desulfurase [Calditrichaeota bacterium]|nr:cysteine desulfurase [Calditrichota bacterium]RQV99945.1 MAG: cysteine desulfurase [Calditrichota bacterium]
MSVEILEKEIKPGTTILNVEEIREDFPILAETFSSSKGPDIPLIYLDNAATTQKPRNVLEAIKNYYSHENANVHRAIHKLGERATVAFEKSRSKIADFINAPSARQVVFTRGTTEAINLVVNGWGRKFIKAGDEILLSEMEHHSNLVPWQLLAKEKGAKLRFIPFSKSKGTLQIGNLEHFLTERTRIISVTHMSNVFGTINPVRGLIQKAREHGIPVMLDGAQSVPHLPTDVQELDCDFLAFSGHKMCGPTGIGILYAKEKYLEEMDPYQGGGEMISAVWLDKATWNDPPHKFEAGTPNIAGAIALGAAVDYLNSIGMEKITTYEQKLTTYALSSLQSIEDMKIYGMAPFRGGVISFNLGEIHPHDMAQFLDSQGIAVRAGHHCAQPVMRKLEIPATTRASFYLYNTFDEIDRLVISLLKAREFFGHGTR